LAAASPTNASTNATKEVEFYLSNIPDFALTNEFGQPLSLRQFTGKAVTLTFFFTRCPIPEYCPRLTKNFQGAIQRLKDAPGGPTNFHFLSISFDPIDTPLLLSVIPEPWRHHIFVAAAADYFFGNRVTATASALAMGAIPFERTKISRRSSDEAAGLIDDGWSFLIFPEGGRSPDGWGQPFRGGAAYLSTTLPLLRPTSLPTNLSAAARQAMERQYATIEITDSVAMMGGHQVALARGYHGRLQNAVQSLESDVLNGLTRYHEMTAVLDKISAGELLARRQDMLSNQLLSHALEQMLARGKRLRDTEAVTINMQLVTWRDARAANDAFAAGTGDALRTWRQP